MFGSRRKEERTHAICECSQPRLVPWIPICGMALGAMHAPPSCAVVVACGFSARTLGMLCSLTQLLWESRSHYAPWCPPRSSSSGSLSCPCSTLHVSTTHAHVLRTRLKHICPDIAFCLSPEGGGCAELFNPLRWPMAGRLRAIPAAGVLRPGTATPKACGLALLRTLGTSRSALLLRQCVWPTMRLTALTPSRRLVFALFHW